MSWQVNIAPILCLHRFSWVVNVETTPRHTGTHHVQNVMSLHECFYFALSGQSLPHVNLLDMSLFVFTVVHGDWLPVMFNHCCLLLSGGSPLYKYQTLSLNGLLRWPPKTYLPSQLLPEARQLLQVTCQRTTFLVSVQRTTAIDPTNCHHHFGTSRPTLTPQPVHTLISSMDLHYCFAKRWCILAVILLLSLSCTFPRLCFVFVKRLFCTFHMTFWCRKLFVIF